jgi:hypothetical protein
MADAPANGARRREDRSLADYLDANRADLEELASKDYPISRVIQSLLDRHDRGEI